MKKIMSMVMPLVMISCINVYGADVPDGDYTFKICYNGGRDGAVDVPDQIDVSTVVHGGSICWTPIFVALAVAKNSFQNHMVTPAQGEWSYCRIVPETVTDAGDKKSIFGQWLNPGDVPPTDEGQTWQIQKTADQLCNYTDPITHEVIYYTISWDAVVQRHIQDCAMPPQKRACP